MKVKELVLICLLFSSVSYGQTGYKKVYKLGEYQQNWSLVKTNAGTYGFIDNNGKEVVPPIYTKIGKFGEFDPNVALVKNISDAYGFIDRSGKEVVPARYTLEEIRQQFKTLYKP